MGLMHRAVALTAATGMAALITVTATACGGATATAGAKTNGLENKSPADVLQAAAAALASAKSVHVVGTVPGGRFDARMQRDSSTGTITKGGEQVQFTKIGSEVYIKTDQAGLETLGAPPTIQQHDANRWLKTGAQNFTSGLTIADLASQLAHHGALAPMVRQATLDGSKVVVVNYRDGSKLYVANTGPAYPLRLQAIGQDAGELDYTKYGAPLHITAPSNAIDVSNVPGTASGGNTTANRAQQSLQSDVSSLLSDSATLNNDKSLSGDITSMKQDYRAEQKDWGFEHSDSCSYFGYDSATVGIDSSTVGTDLSIVQTDIQTLQIGDIQSVQTDLSNVQSDLRTLNQLGAAPGAASSAPIATGKQALKNAANAIARANQSGNAINSQAKALATTARNYAHSHGC